MPVGRVRPPQSSTPPPCGGKWPELTFQSPSEEIPPCQSGRVRMTLTYVWWPGAEMKKIVFGATAVVLVLWAGWLYGVLHFSYGEKFSLQDNGLLGDSFGGLNSLFSALALVGVIATLFTQLVQIKDQADDQSYQQFERQNSTLVDRILLARDSVYVLSQVHRQAGDVTGLRAFKWIGDVARRRLENTEYKKEQHTTDLILNLYTESVSGITYTSSKPFLFYVKEAIDYISTSIRVPELKKRWYANLIFGLLSDEEIFVVAISTLRDGDWFMKARIEEYGLLSNFDDQLFISLFLQFFSEDAFTEHA